MNSSDSLPLHTESRDKDLAEQARPGHGVPSQDPNPEAQIPLKSGEANSVLTGGGMVGGAAVGAATGGPVGVVVGGALGAVAGALGGAAAGPLTGKGRPVGPTSAI